MLGTTPCQLIHAKDCNMTTEFIDPSVRKAAFLVTLHDGEDGYVVASCPSLPGCHSQGRDRAEALANIKEAIEIYVDYLADETDEDRHFVQVSVAA